MGYGVPLVAGVDVVRVGVGAVAQLGEAEAEFFHFGRISRIIHDIGQLGRIILQVEEDFGHFRPIVLVL